MHFWDRNGILFMILNIVEFGAPYLLKPLPIAVGAVFFVLRVGVKILPFCGSKDPLRGIFPCVKFVVHSNGLPRGGLGVLIGGTGAPSFAIHGEFEMNQTHLILSGEI